MIQVMTAKERLMRDVKNMDESRARKARIVVADEIAPETSVDAILARHGEKRLAPEEFKRHFGDLPRDGEG